MRIIVIGSNGFIGSNICETFRKKYQIIGVGRSEISRVEGISYFNFDIASDNFVSIMSNKFGICDVIVHTAAMISDKTEESILLNNCLGALNVLKLSLVMNAKLIIHISSVPIIGIPSEFPITEEHKVFPNSIYHITKLATENILNLSVSKGIKVTHLRITSPVGPGMREDTLLKTLIEKSLKNETISIYGTGSRKQNYIDVRDVVSAVENALIKKRTGVFNIASSSSISNIDLAELCIRTTNSSSQVVCGSILDPEEDINWDVSISKAKRDLDRKSVV